MSDHMLAVSQIQRGKCSVTSTRRAGRKAGPDGLARFL